MPLFGSDVAATQHLPCSQSKRLLIGRAGRKDDGSLATLLHLDYNVRRKQLPNLLFVIADSTVTKFLKKNVLTSLGSTDDLPWVLAILICI